MKNVQIMRIDYTSWLHATAKLVHKNVLQIKRLLHGLEKHQQNEKGANCMGKCIYQRYLGQRFDLQNT